MKQYILTFFMSLAVVAMFAFLPLSQVVAQNSGGTKVDAGLKAVEGAFPTTIAGSDPSPSSLVKTVIEFALYIGAMVAVAFVIFGGYQYMTSGGKEDQAKNGRNTLVNALIGLVIIVFSYVIVQVVYQFITDGPGGTGTGT